jgi:hypothetical protein
MQICEYSSEQNLLIWKWYLSGTSCWRWGIWDFVYNWKERILMMLHELGYLFSKGNFCDPSFFFFKFFPLDGDLVLDPSMDSSDS